MMRPLPILALLLLSNTVATRSDAAIHDTENLKASYQSLVDTLDSRRIARDYSKAVHNLDSENPADVISGLRTLAATEDPAVVPWIVPLLDSNNKDVRIWAGASLQNVISASQLKRRDRAQPGKVVINPPGPNDLDLRPLAWVIWRMLQKPDDGNTHSYAATMIGYLHLTEFEDDLNALLKSRHPAVTNAANVALEMIGANHDVGFSDNELAAASITGKSFGQLFRKNDEDRLGVLLLPRNAVHNVLNAKALVGQNVDSLYEKMVSANTLRFREFRSFFADLDKTSVITFQPGALARSTFYANGVRMMKNSQVTLAYANRVTVKIKIEEMVLVGGKFYIVEID